MDKKDDDNDDNDDNDDDDDNDDNDNDNENNFDIDEKGRSLFQNSSWFGFVNHLSKKTNEKQQALDNLIQEEMNINEV